MIVVEKWMNFRSFFFVRHRDEVILRNKYLEEEARRNAEAEARSKDDAEESDDDIFYDSNAEMKEE